MKKIKKKSSKKKVTKKKEERTQNRTNYSLRECDHLRAACLRKLAAVGPEECPLCPEFWP